MEAKVVGSRPTIHPIGSLAQLVEQWFVKPLVGGSSPSAPAKIFDMELKLYVVRSKDGKYFKSKGYGGYGDSWKDDINQAKIYTKPGPARAQVTFWATHYPKFGTPDLVELVVTEDNMRIVDEGNRMDKVKARKEREQKEKLERETKQKALSWWSKIKGVRDQMVLVRKWAAEKETNKENTHPDDLTQGQIIELYKFHRRVG